MKNNNKIPKIDLNLGYIGPFCDIKTRLVIFVDPTMSNDGNIYLIDVKDQHWDWVLSGHNH